MSDSNPPATCGSPAASAPSLCVASSTAATAAAGTAAVDSIHPRQDRKRRKMKLSSNGGVRPTKDALLASHPSSLCRFWMSQKHRLCTFHIAPPSQLYCQHHNAEETNKERCEYCNTAIRSEPRPYHGSRDRRHVNASEPAKEDPSAIAAQRPKLTPMQAHHLICPKRLLDLECTRLPFYSAGINGEWHTVGSIGASRPDVSASDADGDGDGHAPVSAASASLQDVPRDALWSLIQKLINIGAALGVDTDWVERTDREAAQAQGNANGDELASPAATSLSAHSRLRHQLQHVGFFHLLHSRSLLPRGSLVVEVGAGKAGLVGALAREVDEDEEDTHATVKTNEEKPYDDGKQAAAVEALGECRKKRKLDSPEDQSSTAPAQVTPAPTPASDPTSPASSSSLSSPLSSSSFPPAYSFVVLDRGSFKHKTDVAIRRSGRCHLKRYRIDLQDIALEKMDEITQFAKRKSIQPSSSGMAAVLGKHVCGQATDFVCKAVSRANGAALLSGSPRLIDCVAIATCCHHLCSWENYVNQAYFTQLGLDSTDFHCMTRMSTWRTCGYQRHSDTDGKDNTEAAASLPSDAAAASPTGASSSVCVSSPSFDPSHPTSQLSAAQREHIGAICKHIFDTGRVAFLREAGFQTAERRPYTTSNITKENFSILMA